MTSSLRKGLLGSALRQANRPTSDMDVDSMTPEETAAYIDNEIRKWMKLVKEVGIKGER